MLVARQLSDVKHDNNTIVTVGTFDGVHKAHQAILEELNRRTRETGGRSVLVTFDPHPREVVGPRDRPVELLTVMDERRTLFESYGVDVMLVLPFDRSFSELTARAFYTTYLIEGIGVREVIVGYDHHVGRNREGSRSELERLAKEFGFLTRIVDQIVIDGKVVSSTEIRKALKEGRVEEATGLLGRPYSLEGIVVTGDRRGRQLGYPTANMDIGTSKKLIPSDGIYVTGVEVTGERHSGMMSIGVRPTFFSEGRRTIEVHILDFDRDIYGERIRVTFLHRLRTEEKFASVQALVAQMDKDREHTLTYLRNSARE